MEGRPPWEGDLEGVVVVEGVGLMRSSVGCEPSKGIGCHDIKEYT